MVTQYSYDGVGNRLVKGTGVTTTRYVQDINGGLSNVIAETDAAGTITAYYVHGLGLISKALPDGTAYYYHYDSRGSTIALSDAGENITDAYAYDPFGNMVNLFGVTANPFRYVGMYGVQDEGNGLTYIRARSYVPELGRFITKDPLTGKNGESQSLNRYVYAVNNPVRLVDISGLSSKDSNKNYHKNNRWLKLILDIDYNGKRVEDIARFGAVLETWDVTKGGLIILRNKLPFDLRVDTEALGFITKNGAKVAAIIGEALNLFEILSEINTEINNRGVLTQENVEYIKTHPMDALVDIGKGGLPTLDDWKRSFSSLTAISLNSLPSLFEKDNVSGREIELLIESMFK